MVDMACLGRIHSSLRATPFKVVYGRPPPGLLAYCQGSSKLESVDQELLYRHQILDSIQIVRSTETQYNSSHREIHFNMGDQVLLRLQPHRQSSLAKRTNKKLSSRYYGPFEVLAKIGQVAYKLKLPDSSSIHPVFHVSCLKSFRGSLPHTSTLPNLPPASTEPSRHTVLDNRRNQGRRELLIHWTDSSPAEASWIDEAILRSRFPDFMIADDHVSRGGSNVTPSTSDSSGPSNHTDQAQEILSIEDSHTANSDPRKRLLKFELNKSCLSLSKINWIIRDPYPVDR